MAAAVFDFTLSKALLYLVCLAIISTGYFKRINDKQASIAAGILGFYFIFFFPVYWFASLLLLYIATSIATKQKNKLKAVAHKEGRSLNHILSNLGASLIFSVIYLLDNQPAFYLAFLCSAACACSDTLASEVGQLSRKRPRLITTWQEVKTGVDGGISQLGLVAAAVGSIITVLPAIYMVPHILAFKFFLIASVIGFLGCNIDSVIGATYEIRGKIDNDTTNLIATFASAFLGLLAWFLVV